MTDLSPSLISGMFSVRIGMMVERVARVLGPVRRDLPSRRQWHQLRLKALSGDIEKVKKFLEDSPSKRKQGGSWKKFVGGREEQGLLSLAPWILKEFVEPLEKAQRPMELIEKMKGWGLECRVRHLPPQLSMADLRRVILSRMLVELVDQVLLLVEGVRVKMMTFEEENRVVIHLPGLGRG